MRLQSVVSAMVAGAVVFGACSDDQGAGLGPGASTTTSSVPVTEVDNGVVYVVHAVTTEILQDGDVVRVTLGGVERRTPWLAGDDSGVLPTGALVDQWSDLGLAADPPQAAFVPATDEEPGAMLELSDPAWDEETRLLTYTAVAPDELDPSLVGLIEDPDGDVPADLPNGQIGPATVMIHQATGEPPTTPVTTTTTTTSTTTPRSTTTSSTTSSTVPSTGTPTTPAPTTTIFVAAPLPPTTPPPPPQGDPRIVASTTELRLPSDGGSTTFSLRNLGSGVGSWSINFSQGVDISVAPSAGVIFPGSATTVRVTYGGRYTANDFKAELLVVTAQGSIKVEVTVGGD